MDKKGATNEEQSYARQIASSAFLDIIGDDLASDLAASVTTALEAGASFSRGSEPISIFRDAVAGAITEIEERANLLHRFLRDGPYEYQGKIPAELLDRRLTDDETGKVITFIYSSVVNCFKGQLAELLAAGPCAQLLDELRGRGRVPSAARLYVGDAVLLREGSTGQRKKAADMHILSRGADPAPRMLVHGLVEVKSYARSATPLRRQLAKHLARIRDGALISVAKGAGMREEYQGQCGQDVFTLRVTPARWKLPRSFSFVQEEGAEVLHCNAPTPPSEHALVEPDGPDEWRVTLRWSEEALAAAGYAMTFWYMEKLGEAVFAQGMPKEWQEMTPPEAGRNAAKMMLYYAMRRECGPRVQQRAVALYNAYGFGYALGMNFRDRDGHRQML